MGGLSPHLTGVIGAGIRDARVRKGWRQEDAAHAFRNHGLATWRTGTVGQMEAGLRRSSLGELLVMCIALEVTLADLIPDVGGPVELSGGSTMTASGIRALLAGHDLPADAVTTPGTTPAAKPTDAERQAAARLQVEPAEIKSAARALWGRGLDEERDARIVGIDVMSQRSRQGQRGHVTRALIGELEKTVTR